jgi:hypothetical protein
MLEIYLYIVLVVAITDMSLLWSVRHKDFTFWRMYYFRPSIAVKMGLGSFLILPSLASIFHSIYYHIYDKDFCEEWSDK